MQELHTIKSKAVSLQLFPKAWAPCYPRPASKYSGIRALHLWHTLHLSKQTRTLFVSLFKLEKKKAQHNLSHRLWLHQQELSHSLSILPYSGFEEPLCAAAMRFDLSILCPRASTDNICFACTVLGNAGAPIPAQEQLCYHAETACAPLWPRGADKKHSQCMYATVTTLGQTTVFLLLGSGVTIMH